MKSKGTAAVLAFFLGGFGVHKFYLNEGNKGILYLLFFWTYIPALIAFFECIGLVMMSEEQFNLKYNSGPHITAAPRPVQSAVSSTNNNAQNITINVPGAAAMHATGASATIDVADQIKKLHDLHIAGALTQDEFQSEKQKLLNRDQKLLT